MTWTWTWTTLCQTDRLEAPADKADSKINKAENETKLTQGERGLNFENDENDENGDETRENVRNDVGTTCPGTKRFLKHTSNDKRRKESVLADYGS